MHPPTVVAVLVALRSSFVPAFPHFVLLYIHALTAAAAAAAPLLHTTPPVTHLRQANIILLPTYRTTSKLRSIRKQPHLTPYLLSAVSAVTPSPSTQLLEP